MTYQILLALVLLFFPVLLLAVLNLLLPDEGMIDASVLDEVFLKVTILVIAVLIVVVAGISVSARIMLFEPLRLLSHRASSYAEGRPLIARERFRVREFDELAQSVNQLMDEVMSREERLQRMNEALEDEVVERTAQLQESENHLRTAREQLMVSEKMAVLGSLVTGVSHELNSPLSIGVTAASFLNERARAILSEYDDLTLTQEDLERFLADSEESSRIIQSNLDQAARIIGGLKQVAADQQVDEPRAFELSAYIGDIILSLNHQLRSGKHSIEANADGAVSVNTFAGALTQILNNLVLNSVIHGFENMEGGRISINAKKDGEDALIEYSDNGRGLNPEEKEKLFDQFYTTRRGLGGTGLGMSLTRDLVVGTLGGSIDVYEPEDGGTGFILRFPADIGKNRKSKEGQK